MNRSKLIWGIVLLVIAGGLAIANLALPPENLMFQVGDQNMPWIPPAVLAVIGVFLLATAGQGAEKVAEPKAEIIVDPDKAALNKRLENTGWGLFLIILGAYLLLKPYFEKRQLFGKAEQS